jgi:hypothetical protein
MTEVKPVRESRLKPMATLIASVAALLTSCAAFLEAYDKTRERESYEVLAAKIVELQEAQTQEPFVPEPTGSSAKVFMIPSEPSASPATSASPMTAPTYVARVSDPPMPRMPPPAARPLAPPPSWDGLKK